jgi:hypothetical protein
MALLCTKLSSFDPNISYRSRTLDELNSLCNLLNGSKSKLSNSLQFVLKSRINPKSENEINAKRETNNDLELPIPDKWGTVL